MEEFTVQIVTPKRIAYDNKAKFIEYNTINGFVGVYPSHVPTTQIIEPGEIKIYEEGGNIVRGALLSGFVKIMPDLITVMAEVLEWKDEIDIERATNAKQRAEDRLQKKDSSLDVLRAEVALKRALVRLKIASE
ncbi:MAG: ATP synthase F1 subunit epsilon [Eubacteriales bacterium]|nr:ATP synthase F1 subunit epsilon [Eubacteriales bacterium]